MAHVQESPPSVTSDPDNYILKGCRENKIALLRKYGHSDYHHARDKLTTLHKGLDINVT